MDITRANIARSSFAINSKQLALIICFSGLYAVACFIPLFRIVGSQNFITLAAMFAPTIGMLFGPLIGAASTLIGGFIGFFAGVISPPSLVSGVTAGLLAGFLKEEKRKLCIFVYMILLLVFGFYPPVGPIWLFPPSMWFQIAGFLILIWLTRHRGNLNLTIKFLIFSLVSTLAGQIAGSLTFEVLYWPIFLQDLNVWKGIWQATTFLYPIERILIALGSTLIGVAVHKALENAGLIKAFDGCAEKAFMKTH
ncbi:MAG: hypothetical protein QXG58_07105 [Candidatus Bathyarchaeia archaeon]